MSRAQLAPGGKLWCAAAAGFVLALSATGCDTHSPAAGKTSASPLGVVSAATPSFPVARFGTGGTYPQVRDGKLALATVNRTLREAIVADQRAFERYTRRHVARPAGRRPPSRYLGYYSTELDRTLVSASTALVSVLIPRTRSLLPLRPGADGWLGVTIRVPSGARVRLADLFALRADAMRVLEDRIRTDGGLAPSVRRHPATVLANPQFALLPRGLALGAVEVGWRDVVLVPYSALRPDLSMFGRRLVRRVRPPDFRPDWKHFSYCRRPDNSGAELSATGNVPCTTARNVEAHVFSARCVRRNRCLAAGFTCLAFWDGRYDRPFDFTHHAICHDGKRRIVMDEG